MKTIWKGSTVMSDTIAWMEEHHGTVVGIVQGEGDGDKGRVYVCPSKVWKDGDVSGSLLLDNGECPWGHMSSSITWLIRDLTIQFGERATKLAELYPNGYEMVLATKDGDIPDDVLARNEEWAKTRTKETTE